MLMRKKMAITGVYKFNLRRNGRIISKHKAHNLVTTIGKNQMLSNYLGTEDSVPVNWYVGLANSGIMVPADTLSSHAWTEATPYSGTRPLWNRTTAIGQTISSTPDEPTGFVITSSTTLYGLFLCSVTSGTSGILFSEVPFLSGLPVTTGDNLDITDISFTLS